MSVTSIRLQKDTERLLNEAAGRLKRSKNWLINEAVKQYLAHDRAEQLRWQQTLDALKSASEGKLVEAEKVHTWLESWGTDDEQPPPEK